MSVIFLDWTEINIIELPWKSTACVLMRKLRLVAHNELTPVILCCLLCKFLSLLNIETPTELVQQAQTRKWQENRRNPWAGEVRMEKKKRWREKSTNLHNQNDVTTTWDVHFSDRKRKKKKAELTPSLCPILSLHLCFALFWITITSLPEQTSLASQVC